MNHSETKKLIVTTGVPSPNVYAERVSLVNEAGQPISTKTDVELSSRFVSVYNPVAYGATGGSDDRTAFTAAATAANAVGGVLLIPLGRWNVPGGLDLSSLTNLSIIGYGCNEASNGNLVGSVLVDTAQTGAVLKIGTHPYNHTGRVPIGNFGIEGDNTAGVAKKGLVCSAVTGVAISNIVVKRTGGAPFDFGAMMLSSVTDTLACQPVSASANDVPYYMGTGAMNGNRFTGCGLRSVSTNADATSCVRFVDDGTYAPEHNTFDSWWFEYQHVPSGGTLFLLKGNDNKLTNFLYQDVAYVSNVATSAVRFQAPSINDYGGNEYRGFVPGCVTANANTGVRLSQSGNTVIGTKGYQGKNVTIDATIGRCTILLMGGEASATDAGVINNSALFTNTWVDGPTRNEQRIGGIILRQGSDNQSLQLYRSDGGSPSIEFASTGGGARIFGVSNTLLAYRGDQHDFQDTNAVSLAKFHISNGLTLSGGASGKIGFYGTTPITKPTVSGAKGGNAALGSLITALVNLGLITDTTTA